MTEIDLARLKDPFPEKDIEWRIQSSGIKNGKAWAMVLAYVTNRAIMDRFDDVCGPENWKNEYLPGPTGGMMCGLSIKLGGEWVTKWDGSENTQVEAIKGGFSGSMKRAAVQWGPGRYLYNLDATFVSPTDKGEFSCQIKDEKGVSYYYKWSAPKLPAWALPDGKKQKDPEPKEPPNVKDQLRDQAANDSLARIQAKLDTLTTLSAIDEWEKIARPTIDTLPPAIQAKANTLIKSYKEMAIEVAGKEQK